MKLPSLVRTIPELVGGLLGRHVEHDPASRAWVHPIPHPTLELSPLVIESKRWEHFGPVLTQTIGSCTAEALVNVLNSEPFVDDQRPLFTQEQAVELYSAATRVDKIPGCYPPTDTGSSGLAVCKAAQRMGLIGHYRHAFSLVSALHWLSTMGPCIIGIEWFEGFDVPKGPHAELIISGNVRGGHELALLDVDADARTVRGLNSWSPAWGDGGFFTMSWDTLAILLGRQGDATLPAPRRPVHT